jgi:hypothetical protein
MDGAVSAMKGHAGALESWLAPIFAKLPHLPQGGRKFLVQVAPWLALIFGILGLLSLAGAGALGLLLSPMLILGGGMQSLAFFIAVVLGIISAILALLAFNPLREMRKKGWSYMFYSFVINAIGTLIGFAFATDGFSGLIGIIIGAYIIFEVRESYN